MFTIAGNLLVWYAFAAICTILTRDLNHAGFGSLSISLAQFSVGTALSALNTLVDKNRDNFSGRWNSKLRGIVICYALGHILTNYSFIVMQPSFSHTVKASEPVFTVALSRLLSRPAPNTAQLLSLFPIVLGVMIASFSELAFPAIGLLASLASNLFFSTRNVRIPAINNSLMPRIMINIPILTQSVNDTGALFRTTGRWRGRPLPSSQPR
jgi:solute carrier family 35, member E1